MRAEVELRLEDGQVRSYWCAISPWEAASLREEAGSLPRTDAEIAIFDRLVTADGLEDVGVVEFYIHTLETVTSSPRSPAEPPPARVSIGVGRCRSLMSMATFALPSEIREESVDEWMDEIECAAAEERPVLRRAISILLRSLPILAWRSRLPTRARRPGSE